MVSGPCGLTVGVPKSGGGLVVACAATPLGVMTPLMVTLPLVLVRFSALAISEELPEVEDETFRVPLAVMLFVAIALSVAAVLADRLPVLVMALPAMRFSVP